MSFFTGIIDKYLEEEKGSLEYFDKNGKDSGVKYDNPNKIEEDTKYASFEDFYLAMGKFIGKDFQNQYTKKYRFWSFWEAIQWSAIGFAAFLAGVSIILVIIAQVTTQGKGWPEWLINLDVALIMIPVFGKLSYNWFIQSWVNVYFCNAYYAGLANKESRVTFKKVKRKWNWNIIITIIAMLALGIFASWIEVAKLLTITFLVIPFSLFEGFIVIVFVRLLSRLLPKKKPKKSKVPEIELSPTVRKQVINHFKLIYQDFQKGKYTDAFNRFDSSQKTRAEFDLEIQNFFADKGQALFSLEAFSETETEISISEISENGFEAVLFLYDTKAQEFPEFYLVCQASYQADKLTKLELVELGY